LFQSAFIKSPHIPSLAGFFPQAGPILLHSPINFKPIISVSHP
jgi:hypothetical protein